MRRFLIIFCTAVFSDGASLTYDRVSTPPTDAVGHAVVASVHNANQEAPSATGTLVINKARATLSLRDLAHGHDGAPKAARATKRTVAVFPVENLSGNRVPFLKEIRQFFVQRLAEHGLDVLDDRSLDAFMAKHRLRYAAGIDERTAAALKKETETDAVLFISVELYFPGDPPKIALIARAVSTGDSPRILWSDDVAMSGDETPGLFALGVVSDPRALMNRALDRLSESLGDYLIEKGPTETKPAAKFRPKNAFRSLETQPGKSYKVAVMPFFNSTERRNAGEILTLLFVRHLQEMKDCEVIEPGAIRQQLLDARVIMDSGVSLADADVLFEALGADMILSGRVLNYQDIPAPDARPRVSFTAYVIARESRKTAFSSDSDNYGDDGVRFFKRGSIRTAHRMASQMVRSTAESIVGVK